MTEWAPEEELQTIISVELLIKQLSDIAACHRKDVMSFHATDVSSAFRDTSRFMAAEKIETKVLVFSTLLNMTKSRLSTCTMALTSGKMRRGILDIGGTALKWLLGVSIQQDLVESSADMENMGHRQQQIVHLLDKQATIVNETLQVTRDNLLILQELQKRSLLQNKVDYILDYIKHSELIHVQQMEHFAELDSTFASLDYVLTYVQRSSPRTLPLPAIGIFDVPPGCTARTEDWIFPASLEGQTDT